MDLSNKKNLSKKIDSILFHHNSIRKGLGLNKINKKKLIRDLGKISTQAHSMLNLNEILGVKVFILILKVR